HKPVLFFENHKYGKEIYLKCRALRDGASLTSMQEDKRTDALDQFKFPTYYVDAPEWRYGGTKIKENDLHDLLFREEKLFAGFEIGLHNRGLYWIKAGPLLFAMGLGGKSGFDVSISYIDTKARKQTHLINIICPRHTLGVVVKRFMPFKMDYMGSGTF